MLQENFAPNSSFQKDLQQFHRYLAQYGVAHVVCGMHIYDFLHIRGQGESPCDILLVKKSAKETVDGCALSSHSVIVRLIKYVM